MREEMFLMEEYLNALRILVNARKLPDCHWEKIDSTSSAFVLRFSRYEDMTRYYLQVFLRPTPMGVFALYPLSMKYRNERVVPEAVLKVVKEPGLEGVEIVKLPDKIDEIDVTRLETRDEARYEFGYWAMKQFSFQELETGNFNKFIGDFVFRAEKISDKIEWIYR